MFGFGEIWRIVPNLMDTVRERWGLSVGDMVCLGRFLGKRLCLGFFRVPILLFFGVFELVFGVFCHVLAMF
jgi:hypothetical protein